MHPEGIRRDRQNVELLACGIDPDEFDALLRRLRQRHARTGVLVPTRPVPAAATAETRQIIRTERTSCASRTHAGLTVGAIQ